ARDQRDKSITGRMYFWNVAMNMASDHPLTGVGFNAYQAAYDDYDKTNGEYDSSRSVHSAWFGVLAEMGYPGFILFVALVGLSFRTCRQVRRKAARGEIPEELGRYAVALETALVAFCVGGSFVPFQYCEMLWHFFG